MNCLIDINQFLLAYVSSGSDTIKSYDVMVMKVRFLSIVVVLTFESTCML